ncbi:hypothetical protein Amir_0905 [Actinosynnema mirum DSM 43827]|uniref:AB hydrolase-1 domain-containing protein n=1 Tax=Actinosynnema mirum (strain ATCC 29888 / DSM 43827 / JCM 3225 / NBRC 14064 / NCIMB 13271 / NRRL B-12336 / IMRU 3971 / 101) TaxID=446462 RepID=C6WMD1_ACTMD|nr:hypothetical protein Amir_0905 [Actinosynnema mirum DSM 43827]
MVLVGHSMAALHVEAWARLRPGRVAGLVLVDPDPVAPGGGRPFDPASVVAGWALRCGVHRLSGRRWGSVLGWGGPLLRRGAMAVTTFGRQDRAPGRLVRRVYGRLPVGLAVLAELASFPEQVARVQELREGTALPDVPFEVLAPVARPELEAIAGMSARGRLVVVPGSRHMVHVDRPDAVALAVLRAAGLR